MFGLPGLSKLRYATALKAGVDVLGDAPAIAEPPEGASASAVHAASGFSPLVDAAAIAQARLSAALFTFSSLTDQHDALIAAALEQEEALDTECASIRDLLAAYAKAKMPGAAELFVRFFPDGSGALTDLQGRSQAVGYDLWIALVTDSVSAANPAYGLVADRLQAFAAQAGVFSATLREKKRLSDALSDARAERSAAQTAWTLAFRELIDAGARIHGETSGAFTNWVKPIVDAKANQSAQKTRRAKAAPKPAGEG